MSNTNLTIDMIARKMVSMVYQNLKFIGNINREWESEFAKDNFKIGNDVKIRVPQKWMVRDGRLINPQDVEQKTVTLTVDKHKHVAFNFAADELKFDIDTFVKRTNMDTIASTLAANVEADVIGNLYKKVWNFAGSSAAAVGVTTPFEAQEYLNDELVPEDDNRTLLTSNRHQRLMVVGGQGLYNPQKTVANQYVKGVLGDVAGFTNYSTSLIDRHTTGSYVESTQKEVDGANNQGSTITVKNSTGTFKVGDIVQIEGVYRVHPLTKVSTGRLQNFVVTEDLAAAGTTLKISPPLTPTGQWQNVSNVPANGADILKKQSDHSTAQAASTVYSQSLAFHRDAFAFASVPMETLPGHESARASFDGLTLQITRGGDISNMLIITRVDILYGSQAVLPEFACRIIGS